MRYSLVIKKDDKTYEISGYSKIKGLEHLDEKSLKDIVSFTSIFTNEDELISFLYQNELIPDDIGSLHISYYKNKYNLPKLLPFGISFREDKKFFNPLYLARYFSHHVINPIFMEAFFQKYYENFLNIYPYQKHLNDISYYYKLYLKDGIKPFEASNAMREFIKSYLEVKDSKNISKTSFSRLRDLAMFAIDYERTYIRNPIDVEIQKQDYLNSLINDLEFYEEILIGLDPSEEIFDIYMDLITGLKGEINTVKDNSIARIRRIDTNGTSTN